MDKNKSERSIVIKLERRENIISEWEKYILLEKAKEIGIIRAEQGDQSGAERADIRGEKLELHAQENSRKREVARSGRDGTLKFYKGVE